MLYEALSKDQVSITRYQDAGGSINKLRLYPPELVSRCMRRSKRTKAQQPESSAVEPAQNPGKWKERITISD
jgi:hypothetical protein